MKRKPQRGPSRGGPPSNIGAVIQSLKATTALGGQLDQAAIWERWPEFAGEPLWMHGKPTTLKRSRLTVHVDSSIWMNQYAYHQWDIIARINEAAKRQLVKELRLTLEPEG